MNQPTKEQIDACVNTLSDIVETCTDCGISYPSVEIADLRTILAALESAQAEVTALEKQVDELQTELSKWPT
jgi:uncharacterized protein YlxW (UPF0749 family)